MCEAVCDRGKPSALRYKDLKVGQTSMRGSVRLIRSFLFDMCFLLLLAFRMFWFRSWIFGMGGSEGETVSESFLGLEGVTEHYLGI